MTMNDASTRLDPKHRQSSPLITPTDLRAKATKDITGGMNAILADVFAIYLKTKIFRIVGTSGPPYTGRNRLTARMPRATKSSNAIPCTTANGGSEPCGTRPCSNGIFTMACTISTNTFNQRLINAPMT